MWVRGSEARFFFEGNGGINSAVTSCRGLRPVSLGAHSWWWHFADHPRLAPSLPLVTLRHVTHDAFLIYINIRKISTQTDQRGGRGHVSLMTGSWHIRSSRDYHDQL